MTNLIERIRAIDAQIEKLESQATPIRQAMQTAGQMQAEAVPQISEIQAKRRNAVADWLLGIVSRTAVDEIQRETKAAEEDQENALRQRELAELGAAELESRIAPIRQQIAELRRERQVVMRAAIRERAELVGQQYRTTVEAMAEVYARLQAHSEVLNDLENASAIGAPAPDGGRQGFGNLSGPQDFAVPIFPNLQAFRACAMPTMLVSFHPSGYIHPGSQVQVDYQQTLTDVQRELQTHGLLAH